MTRAVLLSIRPRFAKAILDGSKTYELRRRFPKLEPGTVVYLYSSSPDMAIVGSFVSAEIKRAAKDELWHQLQSELGLAEHEFSAYLDDQAHGVGIGTTGVREFETPIPLSEIRTWMKVEAPQSFRYLPASAETWLRNRLADDQRQEHIRPIRRPSFTLATPSKVKGTDTRRDLASTRIHTA